MNFKKIYLLLIFLLNSNLKSSQKADLLVFSYDRPMQLHSFFESVEKYIKNIDEIWVIYRTSNERYDKAYETCFSMFSNLNIKKIKQLNESAEQTFKSLLMHFLKSNKNKYILFGVDDIIVKDHIDLSECIGYLEKTNAFGFYLRLGKNISECYTEGIQTPIPNHKEIEKGVYSLEFKEGKGDWGYPCCLDMTLYNKEKIMESINKINFSSPNRFEGNWHINEWFYNANKDKVGLFFEESKIVNIPMNVVQSIGISKNMGISSLELLEKFEKGLKIDINPFYKIYNKAPHIEFEIIYKSIFPFAQLYDAIKNKDLNSIEKLKLKFAYLIKQKANDNIYNLKDENGYTPLMWAANSQYIDAIKFLLENNANPNIYDKNEFTALMYACWRGNPEIVDLLIKNKADVDAIDVNGTTALSLAAQLPSGIQERIISLLIGEEI